MTSVPPPPPSSRRRLPGCCYPLLACLLVPFLPFVAIPLYNHWAEKAFKEHAEEIAAKGESLDIEAFRPARTGNAPLTFPNDPFILSLLEESKNRENDDFDPALLMDRLSLAAVHPSESVKEKVVRPRYFGVKPLPEFDDLSEETDRARRILDYCESIAPELDAFAEAVRKPTGHFDLRYEDGYAMVIPELRPFLKTSELLAARSKSALLCGDTSLAAADIETLIDLSNQMGGEPALICHLVHVSLHGRAIGCLHEGLQRSAWSEDQLDGFKARIESPSFLPGYYRSLRMERAMFVHFTSMLRENPRLLFEMAPEDDESSPAGKALASAFLSVCSGWYYDNARFYSEAMQREMLGDSIANPEAIPSLGGNLQQVLQRKTGTPLGKFRYTLAVAGLPVYDNVASRVLRAEVYRSHALLALEIERFRLVHGRLPGSLAELPSGLPLTDPFTGDPWRYEILPDGTYQLYSIGPNRIDEGGMLKKDSKAGDWVWRLTIPEDFDPE